MMECGKDGIRTGDKSDGCDASGGTSRSSKALKLLESQGIISGRTLGCGTYAKVKSAYDVNKKHKVAVKIINKKKAFEEYLRKFLPREIEAMKAMSNHYALIKFYQIIETTSRYFFIMELADKGDLLTIIKHHTYLPEKQAGIWFINLTDGLIFMHAKGIVHRDIKCENLVIDARNTLKITDFGFAKRIGKTKSGTPLLSETYCGSYAYAPPEILKGLPYDPEVSDVWSMGVVLFTMVYGRLPFEDGDHKKLLKQVLSKIIFPGKPEVSEMCRILIIKILSKTIDRVPLRNIKADPWFKAHLAYFAPDHPKFQQKLGVAKTSLEVDASVVEKDSKMAAVSKAGNSTADQTRLGVASPENGSRSMPLRKLKEPAAGPSTIANIEHFLNQCR